MVHGYHPTRTHPLWINAQHRLRRSGSKVANAGCFNDQTAGDTADIPDLKCTKWQRWKNASFSLCYIYIICISPSYYMITWYYISFTSQFSDTIFPPKSHQLFPSFPHILIQRQTPWRPAAPGGPGTVAPVPVLVRGAAVAASPPGMARCWDLDFFVFFFARKNGDSTNNNGDLTWFNMI